jgi:hypothetical protein
MTRMAPGLGRRHAVERRPELLRQAFRATATSAPAPPGDAWQSGARRGGRGRPGVRAGSCLQARVGGRSSCGVCVCTPSGAADWRGACGCVAEWSMPCPRLEEPISSRARAALQERGGVCCRVLEGGESGVGRWWSPSRFPGRLACRPERAAWRALRHCRVAGLSSGKPRRARPSRRPRGCARRCRPDSTRGYRSSWCGHLDGPGVPGRCGGHSRPRVDGERRGVERCGSCRAWRSGPGGSPW